MMLEVYTWGICDEGGQKLLNSFYFFSESYDHDCGSLAVPNIVDLSMSNIVNEAKSSRQIMHGHFVDTEIPKI